MRRIGVLLCAALLGCAGVAPRPVAPERPFGTLREQSELEHQWLKTRLETALPRLMRQYGIDLWVVPMREYNEDPVFKALVDPTTFAARRRTIYVFFDKGGEQGIERLALGGGSQGGLYDARRARSRAIDVGHGAQGELWGDEQWLLLKELIEERKPKAIGVNISRTFAFADGLSAGELEAMSAVLGPEWVGRFKRAEGLAVDFLAYRAPGEEKTFERMNALAWEIITTAFSSQVIEPGKTRVQDVEWWMRQRLNDLGLGTWFHPDVDIQRQGVAPEQLGDNPVIQRGDLLHCDFGVTALRLNTDTQHMGYVLREGEAEAPAGLKAALAASNRVQDIVSAELRAGRTGNEVLKASLARMKAEGLEGSVYSHPVGLNGHGAGPLVGLWDHQEGVPGRGDQAVILNQWFSIELQATSAVPEWNGQRVRSGQEEDVILDADGKVRWAHKRQTELHLVR